MGEDAIKGEYMWRKRKESRPESWVITLNSWKEEVNPTNEIKTKKSEMEKETGRMLCQEKNGTK